MAEGKNTVIVYIDWIDNFESLTDDEAGRLIKHFFRYVNDKNPVAPDRLTEISFIPIKNSLKRDLKKWELEINKKSNSGKLGNLKRWNLDLYESVIKMQISIDEAEIIAQNRKESQSIALRQNESQGVALRQNESQGVANIAVTDTVSDTVTVTENNSFSKKKKKLTIEEYVKENKSTLGEIFSAYPAIKKTAFQWIEYKFKKKGYKETKWATQMVERIKKTSVEFIEQRIIDTIAGETYEDYFYANHQVEFDKQNKTQGKETPKVASKPQTRTQV